MRASTIAPGSWTRSGLGEPTHHASILGLLDSGPDSGNPHNASMGVGHARILYARTYSGPGLGTHTPCEHRRRVRAYARVFVSGWASSPEPTRQHCRSVGEKTHERTNAQRTNARTHRVMGERPCHPSMPSCVPRRIIVVGPCTPPVRETPDVWPATPAARGGRQGGARRDSPPPPPPAPPGP